MERKRYCTYDGLAFCPVTVREKCQYCQDISSSYDPCNKADILYLLIKIYFLSLPGNA